MAPRIRHLVLNVAALALLASACRRSGESAPGQVAVRPPGDVSGEVGGRGGTGGRAPVAFAQVVPILRRACAEPCHDGRAVAADDFLFKDEGDLRERLLTAAPATVPVPCQDRPLVVPGGPERSLLMAVIEEPEGPRRNCAERMPQGCPERRPCLSEAEIGTIRRWIQAGAGR